MEQDSWLKKVLKSLRMNEGLLSTLLGGLVVVIVGILIYNYFSSVSKTETTETEEIAQEVELVEEEGELVPSQLPQTHVVQAGEHLWSIAEKYYTSGYNWVDIAEENNLSNPNLLAVGQELTIPRKALKQVTDETQASPVTQYVVAQGDSLWTIAVQVYADGYRWTEIYEANSSLISNPDVIESGMVLQIP